MPEEVCCICHKHIKYHLPLEDKKKIQGMCHVCEKLQDQFLKEIKDKEKRVDKYKEDHHL